jgi:hypothetical protein
MRSNTGKIIRPGKLSKENKMFAHYFVAKDNILVACAHSIIST